MHGADRLWDGKLALRFRDGWHVLHEMTTIHKTIIYIVSYEGRNSRLGRNCMDRSIARLNIEHYRKKLAEEGDETKRQTLLRLLAEEEAKLAALDGSPRGNRAQD